MNTNTQILIDHKILRRVAWLLNLLVTFAGKIAPKDHNLRLPFRKIAVCKFKGMGSIVQATPLLQSLKKQYPDARISFISTPTNEAMLQNIPIVDEVIILNDRSIGQLFFDFIPFILKVFRRNFDVYIDLEVYSNFGSIVSALSNAKNRFGYYQKESNYKLGIYTHMMYYNNAVPIYQTYLQWTRLLGCKNITTTLYPINSTYTTIKIDQEIYPLTEKKYFVINPNASDLRIERRWPAASFTELITKLTQCYTDTDLILIGSKAERDYVASITPSFSPSIKNIAGLTSISELIAVMQHATLVITNDTGPMHLAFALKKKTLALFGPCAPDQYGNHENAQIIYKNVYCSPCVHEFRIPPCLGNNQCMKQISVDEVLTEINRLTSDIPLQKVAEKNRTYTTNDPDYDILGMVKRKTY
ncbi:MAG: glycosyltransferase family 9 protein [Bacteroidetes bacterium]|nr:glycosyltransferase family 9 protein [Bacteroidota bacterium]